MTSIRNRCWRRPTWAPRDPRPNRSFPTSILPWCGVRADRRSPMRIDSGVVELFDFRCRRRPTTNFARPRTRSSNPVPSSGESTTNPLPAADAGPNARNRAGAAATLMTLSSLTGASRPRAPVPSGEGSITTPSKTCRIRHGPGPSSLDSSLEGTGFELLVRERLKLVVGRRRQRNRTARRRRCRCASVTFDRLVPRTRAGGASTSLCSTVGARTAPRTPFHRSRDRARYRYYEGSRSGPAVTACQHYFENCSFSRDVMRQSSRAVLRQRSKRV